MIIDKTPKVSFDNLSLLISVINDESNFKCTYFIDLIQIEKKIENLFSLCIMY